MEKKRNWLQGLLAAIGLLVLILDSALAVKGATAGLELCIKTVIPPLFPFFVLSSVLTTSLMEIDFSPFRLLGKALGMSERASSVLVSALLGGYPVGAKCVGDLYQRRLISQQEAERLLAFCSNAGPSFLFGMVAAYFPDPKTAWVIWLIHIGGALLTAMVIPPAEGKNIKPNQEADIPTGSAIVSAAKAMELVCCWVILFRMIITFLEAWFLWALPDWAQILTMGLLELTNGCCQLTEIADVRIRFVLCCCMLSFGGICVLLQTASVTKGLRLWYYWKGKLLQTMFSLLFSCSIVTGHRLLFAAFVPILILVFRKIQNRYGNPHLFPV